MKTIGFSMILGLAALSACTEENPGPADDAQQRAPSVQVAPAEPPAPRAALQLLPDDLATGVREMAPLVLVAGELTIAEESALKAALKIVEWPSRKRVTASVKIERRAPEQGDTLDRYIVVPEGALPAGWYALAVDTSALPSRLASAPPESPWAGHLVARFATHATTIVSSVDTAHDGEGSELRVRLSSRVRDERAGSTLVRVTDGGNPVTCRSQNDAALMAEEGTEEVVLRCPTLAAPVVTVDAEVRSLDGVLIGQAYSGPAILEAGADRAGRRIAVARALRL
ncbi:MAG TPA: hypothetical protein VGK73_07455 [Polyangiaceae bacterium]